MAKFQSIPTLAVVGVWDEGSENKHPENAKILFSTGEWVMYRLDITQPAPHLKRELDKFTDLCVGYPKR